jgi:hypothetical protein
LQVFVDVRKAGSYAIQIIELLAHEYYIQWNQSQVI